MRLEEHEPCRRPCGRASWQVTAKPDAIKGQSGKRGKDARKVNVLTWGDLPPGCQSNPNCEVWLRWQESAEAIVPLPSKWEGLNIEKMSTTSSSQDKQRRPNASSRGTAVQAKRVKPVGIVQRVELSTARDGGKSGVNLSTLLSVNRRMRTRMSGGVRGGG